ncbi:Plectin/S10 domain-containing protein [Aspergillus oleicola]
MKARTLPSPNEDFRTFQHSAATLHSINLHFNQPLRALLERFPEEQQELATMLIPKEDRKKIHEYLFREGVLVAKKDFNLPKHGDIDTKNLYVIKACQSLNSRGYIKTQFSWQYYYYTLTPEGLDYLREWLHLPAEVVPATHIKQQRSHAPPRGMMGGEERERRPRPPREGGYRRREEGKEGGAPGEFAPSFRGGFGRGRGAPSS